MIAGGAVPLWKHMQEPFDTEFLIRRVGQLWTEAANLPESSPVQQHIETLALALSDYVAYRHDNLRIEPTKGGR
jgi:hypothetical protein